MSELQFFDIAALTGDHRLRRELKEVWDSLHPPSDRVVEAHLSMKHGFGRSFTDEERAGARSYLMHLMAEDALRRRLGWSDDDLWADETAEEAAAAWPAEAAPDLPPGALNGVAGGASAPVAGRQWSWLPANDNPPAAMRPASEVEIVDAGTLVSPDGSIPIGDDGEFVFVRCPPGRAAKGLRLGPVAYPLERATGLRDVFRLAGLSKPAMRAFLKAHRGDPGANPVEWVC